MAAAPQQGQNDSSAGILWVVSALFAGMLGIWYSGQKFIVTAYFKVKLAEISVLSFFTSNLDDVKSFMLSSDPAHTSMDSMLQAGAAVGYYLRIPCIAFILMLAVLVFFSNTVRTFKRTYSMKDLASLEMGNWPQISPIIKLDLVKTDIDKGPWAMAMTPVQFCKRFNLLEEYKRQPTENMSRKEMNRIEVRLKRGDANKIFAMQLGPLWMGAQKLPLHTKALFAIFAGRMEGDPAAVKLIRQLGETCTTKLDFRGVDELIKKYGNHKEVKKITDNHAYVMTVMASMLVLARTDGVQASADFLWLKPIDRRLWYTLNTVGRQTPFAEVAGIFAHWVAEKEIGKKLFVPMIDEATNALELSLKEIIYIPDEK
jgi:intracellular multiplication protein IcmP